jgi:DNA-binding beta-propeller fold protein YncE
MRRKLNPIVLLGVVGALVAALFVPAASAQGGPAIELTPVGGYETGLEAGSEIVAYDAGTQRMFVTNGAENAIDIIDISDPSDPSLVRSVDLSSFGSSVQSVAVGDRLVAAAVAADDPTARGTVVTFRPNGRNIESYRVGVLPDAIAFTPDGTKIVVANEAEPVCDGENLLRDPRGSISIVDLEAERVRTAGFGRWIGKENALRNRGVRIFFPGSNAAQDLEPEYVAISPSGRFAYVTLQENNAIAVVNIERARVQRIIALGSKDHSVAGNGLDPSNEDGGIDIDTWNVRGLYMPDAISVIGARNPRNELLVTANEGDARDYDCYSEEIRIGELDLDPTVLPNAAELQQNANLGRLNSTTSFDTAGVPTTELYSFGARSFSIWDEAGGLVFDSGDDFEQITAERFPAQFNSNNDDNDSFDSRSDDKGPEPEAVEIATVYSKTYAFIGLERVGGIMVYDITTPRNPQFVEYVNRRDFSVDAEASDAGDLGPEGLTFIAPADSPNGQPLLVVANEVSGTTTIFQIDGPGRPR